MKADEFYRHGQMIRGVAQRILPGIFEEKDESPEAPAGKDAPQPGAAPAPTDMQAPDSPASVDAYSTGRPAPEQSPRRGRPASREVMDPSYAGSGEFELSNQFAYDQRVVDQIVKKYVAAGYDPRYAIGMAANGIVESSLVPTAFNEKEGAFGMFQWRNDRLDGLKAYADRAGKTIDTINTNIDFSLEELRTTERSAHNRIVNADPQTAAEYARLIDKYYERSSGEARERRASIAAQLWRDYYGDGGRADGPMLSYSKDTVPIQPNAQSRAEVMDQMARETDPSQLDMGRYLEAQSDRADDLSQSGGLDNPAVEFMVGQSVQPAQAPQAPPTTAELSGEQPLTQSTQSPTGGQLGTSAQAAGTGSMRDGVLGGLQDIFGRREGEADASFADRRRNIFLNAAEGFQMLSRGVKADFVTPTQQRLNEKQRRVDNRFRDIEQVRQQGNFDTNMAMQQRQEDRLERRLQLDIAKEQLGQAAKMADLQQDQEMRSGMVDFFATQGYQDLATLAQQGAAKEAFEIYKQREEGTGADVTGPDSRTLSDAGAAAMSARARELGRDDLATVLGDRKENSRAAWEAYKEVLQLEAEATPEGEFNEYLYDSMLRAIPKSMPPSKQEELKAAAEVAARSGSDTVLGKWFDTRDDAINSVSPTDQTMETYYEAQNERFKQKLAPGAELAQAGRMGLEMASNPAFNPNQLKGSVLTPIARFLRGVPGGEELSESLIGVTDQDVFATRLLDSIKNKQLGNLAQGVTGQLSNLEGTRLLSALGDGTMERTEIMALSQLMVREREAEIARQDALLEYKRQVQNGEREFSVADATEAAEAGGKKVKLFNRVASDEDRRKLMMRRLEEFAAEEGLTIEEVKQMDHTMLPSEIKGEVVSQQVRDSQGRVTGVEFVPLFKEAFEG